MDNVKKYLSRAEYYVACMRASLYGEEGIAGIIHFKDQIRDFYFALKDVIGKHIKADSDKPFVQKVLANNHNK